MTEEQKEILQSQLNSEKAVIKELEKVYKQALMDCKSKIELLSARAELNPENLDAVIYQKNFQEAIKAQLEGVLVSMDSDVYSTISEYLNKCYEEGYVGVMYDLASQGIPLVMPIDQKGVMKAVQTDSQLSSGLYKRLGEDVKELKKAVSAELSRGIANGYTWNQTAANLARNFKNTPFNKAYNNSIRIARTEGHRVQTQSALDAQHKAKKKGADIVKQWDASLDGRTRPTHRQLDGQIREIDEPFEVAGLKADAPGMFGDPSEDCNCRCALLQRARWALGEEELQTLKDRAEYYELDKSKDFEDFKGKYLNISDDDIKGADSGSVRSSVQKISNDSENIENTGKNGIIEVGQTKQYTKVKTEDIPPMEEEKFYRIKEGLERKGIAVIQDADGDDFLKYMNAEAMTLSDGSAVIFQSGRVPSASAVFEEVIHTTQILNEGVIDSIGDPEGYIKYLNREISANEKLIKYQVSYGLTKEDVESVQQNLDKYYKELKEVKKDV